MNFWRSALLRRQVRVALYVLIVLGLFLLRGPRNWRALRDHVRDPQRASTLIVAGVDLAPRLFEALTQAYERDEPAVSVGSVEGGTTHALQALLEGRANVAVLARPPLDSERSQFTTDLSCEPIALGALVLTSNRASGIDSLTWPEIEGLVRGHPNGLALRLYSEDPNTGLWDVLTAAFGVDGLAEAPGSVVFLENSDACWAALRADTRGVALMSSFTLPVEGLPPDLGTVGVVGPDGAHAVWPTYEDMAYGRYPLLQHLHLAWLSNVTGHAAKFVTLLTSGRGQRLVERAGYLPARQVLREIILSDAPQGAR